MQPLLTSPSQLAAVRLAFAVSTSKFSSLSTLITAFFWSISKEKVANESFFILNTSLFLQEPLSSSSHQRQKLAVMSPSFSTMWRLSTTIRSSSRTRRRATIVAASSTFCSRRRQSDGQHFFAAACLKIQKGNLFANFSVIEIKISTGNARLIHGGLHFANGIQQHSDGQCKLLSHSILHARNYMALHCINRSIMNDLQRFSFRNARCREFCGTFCSLVLR